MRLRLLVLAHQGIARAEEALGLGNRGRGEGEETDRREAALQTDAGTARAVHGRQ